MSDILPAPGIVLHIWPGRWDLPSFDPLCLAAVLYMQATIPGKFRLVECSNSDSSPTGHLPFLIHEQFSVSSFASIVKYISRLKIVDPDRDLSPTERAQRTAWYAHVEYHLGDLVYSNFYTNQDNWTKLVNPALASMFPIPQKYYVPGRMRDAYFHRLVAAGLWKQTTEEKPAESPFPRDAKPLEKTRLKNVPTLSRAFDREKVTAKARAELEIYSELLDCKSFVFRNKLTSLDLLLAAHILLLTKPPFPDPLLKDLISNSYPSLLSHAQRVYAETCGDEKVTLSVSSSPGSLLDILPSWPKGSAPPNTESPEDIHYKRMRWGFFGLLIGSLATYFAIVGPQYTIAFRVIERESPDAASRDREGEVLGE